MVLSPEPARSPRVLDAGEAALVVEFGDAIDEATNARVLALDAAMTRRALGGVREMIPTYRSLLIVFDPLVLPRADLRKAVTALLDEPVPAAGTGTRWRVPVLYGGPHGADLAEVAARHGLTPEAVVALHAGGDYRVYMIGFSPGFSYLGGLPARIHTSRRPAPRLQTPPRTISIGGQQAAVTPPLTLPSGWNLLGQTPVHSYDPRRGARPFLFAPGDRIRFEPIGESDYAALCRSAEAGDIVARQERCDPTGPPHD